MNAEEWILALAAQAALIGSRRLSRRTRMAAILADVLVLLGLSFFFRNGMELAYFFAVPGALFAVERGAAPGAALAFSGAVLSGWAAGAGPLLALARAAAAALPALAAGLTAGAARADAAAQAGATIGRLRVAQVGEHLSFMIFQIRDYMITLGSLAETIARDVPKENKDLAGRADKLKRTLGELNEKLTRLLGGGTTLTTIRAPSPAAVDLAAAARWAVEEARRAFAPDGARLGLRVEGDVPPADTDRRWVELALLALLQNALEACAARGRGQVLVAVRRGGENAEIEVSDDGGGIPDSLQPRVFEPFESARPERHGLGLGLSMSRRFLDRLGATLSVSSRGGRTSARIVLPLKRALPVIRSDEATWALRRDEARPT